MRSKTLEEIISDDPKWLKTSFFNWLAKNSGAVLLCALLLLLYGFFLFHKIDLVTADLGRHIKNGEILQSDASVLSTNFYSYTEPSFPVQNHHWGSGLAFFAVWRLFGFEGLQLFFIFLCLAALFVFLHLGGRYGGLGIAGISAVLVIPLLAQRTEIRPEVFSYLFAGLFYLILSRERNGVEGDTPISWKRICWLLPFIQIVWANTHIYFILGPLIVGAFLLESIILRSKKLGRFLLIFIAVIFSTLINPFGYKMITESVTIFGNYGYRLAENQSVWFMEKLSSNPSYLIFKILFLILAVSFIVALYRNRRGLKLSDIFIASGISVMAWFAVRNFALFGLFFIVFFPKNLQVIFSSSLAGSLIQKWAIAVAAAALIFTLFYSPQRFFPYYERPGLGLLPGNSNAAQFIKEQKIKGPIFNNYDIGGYLIYHLFPGERVFVDNRPEAYPPGFFGEYIGMQEDDKKWDVARKKRDFNAIVFSYRDMTPWAQKFLIARVKDKAWAPVYADNKIIVFLRRSGENEAVIGRFGIGSEAFKYTE